MFNPDVDSLIKKHTIDKPNEEFAVAPVNPDPDPNTPVIPLGKTEFDVPLLPITTRLGDEASRVQELIDLLTNNVAPLSVPIPPEHAAQLGSSLTTSDYLKSLESPDDVNSQIKRQNFEWSALNTDDPTDATSWHALIVPDLIDIRNDLLATSDLIEGTLLSASQTTSSSGDNGWKTSVLNSDLVHVHESVILASAKFRFKVGQTVFTAKANLNGAMLDHILGSIIDPQVEKIRPAIKSVISFLTNVRGILSHSQLLLAFEFVRSRDAVLNIIEQQIIDRLTNILSVQLSKFVNGLVTPILNTIENGLSGTGPLLNVLTDQVSQDLVNVISSTAGAVTTQYKGLVADLLRQHDQKRKTQMAKLQFLGEKNTVGRWITHIDQIIAELSKILNNVNLGTELAAQAVQRAIAPPQLPKSNVLQSFFNHPELSQAEDLFTKFRSFGLTPGLVDPTVVPFVGEGPQLPDAIPVFGTGDVDLSNITSVD